MDSRRKSRGLDGIPHRPFIGFLILLLGLVAALASIVPVGEAFIFAFDAAALVFILSIIVMMGSASPEQLRDKAAQNDAGRTLLLIVAALLLLVVLLVIVLELGGAAGSRWEALDVVFTLAVAWLFTNIVYALHYTHMFYDRASHGGDAAGLLFPGTAEPGFWDFCYFAFVLGMTFQVSDVQVRSPQIRHAALGHGLVAFFFNIGVVALTVNVIARVL